MSISAADFEYVRDFVYQRAAIVLEPGKDYLVESRVQPVARREGFTSVSALIATLRSQPANDLHWSVVEAMATNETYFFRDVHPFELLKTHVVPELIKRRARARQINIWCAAASSGQEPYTIAMTLREKFPELLGWNIKFLASDISREMLNRCGEGCYSQLEVNRGLPEPLLAKYFRKSGAQWKINDELKRMIEFQEVNLAQRWPAMPPMDIVFIRNVLIYFDVETKKDILKRLRTVMQPDGYLFLGGAETTLGIEDSFRRVPFDKTAYYQLKAD